MEMIQWQTFLFLFSSASALQIFLGVFPGASFEAASRFDLEISNGFHWPFLLVQLIFSFAEFISAWFSANNFSIEYFMAFSFLKNPLILHSETIISCSDSADHTSAFNSIFIFGRFGFGHVVCKCITLRNHIFETPRLLNNLAHSLNVCSTVEIVSKQFGDICHQRFLLASILVSLHGWLCSCVNPMVGLIHKT